MNHEQAQKSISGYLRGELPAHERRDFLAHLNSCPRCESELAIAARLHTELPVAAPYNVRAAAPLPAPLAARVLKAVQANQRKRRPFGWLEWMFPGAQSNVPRLLVNVLGVFVLLATVAIGAVAMRNAFQPGPNKPGYAANFTYAQQPGLTYIFTDTTVTSDTLTYTWDFGDGGKATDRNPMHNYGMTGIYTVSMTVSGPKGQGNKPLRINVSGSTNLSPTPSPSPTAATVTAVPQGPQNTVTPAPTDTLAPPQQPTTTLPNLDPTPNLLPSVTPLPLLPTPVAPQASPTRLAPVEPTSTPRPQPTSTRQAEPSSTPLPTDIPPLASSPTPTPALLNTSTPTATRPAEATNTLPPAPSNTPVPTFHPEPSATPTPTLPALTNTPRPEPTHTPRPEPTSTPIIEPSSTPRPSETPQPSATPTPTVCGDACNTPVPTNTPDCGHECQTPPPTATHAPPPTNTPPEPTHPPTATPHPEPTQTPGDATETPGPTCTPQLGDDHDQHGC